MIQAPLISTVIAIGLIPVTILFIHAFLSGIKGWRFHQVTGGIAVTWDLSLSFGYMIIRALGLQVEGSGLEIKGGLLLYFIIHGTISAIVIMLELATVATGFLNYSRKKKGLDKLKWHGRLAKVLFALWWFSFLTGEFFYVAVYIL